MLYFDTETCGFHGPAVTIQYAEDDGEINIHHIWREPIIDTLKLIEEICQKEVCGFNLTYDWFHLCKTYTTLMLLGEKVGYDEWPVDHIDTYAELEPAARDGACLKPKSALDIMLHARKGPYQSTMDRRNITIKRVPNVLARLLRDELEARIPLRDIYFSRKKDKKAERWSIREIKGTREFVDVVLKFAPSAALKVLASDALGVKDDDILKFSNVGVPRKYNPVEVGWAPFALALSNKKRGWMARVKKSGGKKEGPTWPGVIERHIDHWAFDVLAKRYGADDVKYTRALHRFFGSPPAGDNDSILACMVGAVRWRGFGLDHVKLDELYHEALKLSSSAPKAPHHVKKYLCQVLTPDEQVCLRDNNGKEGTGKVILETIAKMDSDCPNCKGEGTPDCVQCKGTGAVKHPAATRAEECLNARKATTKLSLYEKLRKAGRLHASLKVIGALSSRMSGADGLNSTGIQHEKKIRSIFTFALGDLGLCGGDFAAYEVSIADARYNDPELRNQLLTCWVCEQVRTIDQYEETNCPNCGCTATNCKNKKCKKIIVLNRDNSIYRSCGCDAPNPGVGEDTLRKIHGLFGQELAPGKSYVDILNTKGQVPDLYDQGKRGIFSQLYGGNFATLMSRLGIEEEAARQAEQGFQNRFQGVGKARKGIEDRFCSMKQTSLGAKVTWNEPDEYVESLTGFKRYFTLENQICRVLFELAEDPPEEWNKLRIECVRREGRVQKVGGAVRTAVFAAAFQIQSRNMRAAANHEIQSTGAILTKELQCDIWALQPFGVNKWAVQPFQVHDEIMVCRRPELDSQVYDIVQAFVRKRKSLIPLLRIDWSRSLNNWSEK